MSTSDYYKWLLTGSNKKILLPAEVVYDQVNLMLWCLESSRFSIGFWSDADNITQIFQYLLIEFLNMIKEGMPSFIP